MAKSAREKPAGLCDQYRIIGYLDAHFPHTARLHEQVDFGKKKTSNETSLKAFNKNNNLLFYPSK